MNRVSQEFSAGAQRAWSGAFYWSMSQLTALLLAACADLRVVGRRHVPPGGPFILAANHLSLFDPPLLSAVLPRRLRFMAKQELFTGGFGGFCVRSFGAFPVARFEADRRALRTAQTLLRGGDAIAMFPEGHRSDVHALQSAQPGTGFLALLCDAPVLPVGITGTERIRSPRAITQRPAINVRIGAPLEFDRPARTRAQDVQLVTERIMEAIAALLPAEYRGVYTRSETEE